MQEVYENNVEQPFSGSEFMPSQVYENMGFDTNTAATDGHNMTINASCGLASLNKYF